MKNAKIFKLIRVLMLLPCLVFLVNCSKSSDKNRNNGCYVNQYGQQICNNGGIGGGIWQNGQCYLNGQPVAPTYCQNNGGGYGQMCDGVYFSPQHGQSVCCGSACMQWYGQYGNCSGLQLVNQMTGQMVFCQ